MHVLDLIDLWERFIVPEFKARAPKRLLLTPLDVAVEVKGKISRLVERGWECLSQV